MIRVSKVPPAIAGTAESQRKIAESLSQIIDKAQPFGVRTATATITVTDEYGIYVCDASAAAMTVNLPEAAAYKGSMFWVKKVDPSANAVLVDGFGSETIDGSITASIGTQYDVALVASDGSGWARLI